MAILSKAKGSCWKIQRRLKESGPLAIVSQLVGFIEHDRNICTYIHVWKHTNVHAAHFLHLSPADNKFGFEARKKFFRVLLLKAAFKKLDGWVLKYTLYVLCRCLSTILLKQSSMLTPCWDFMREVKKKGKRLSKFLGDYSDEKRKGKARKATLELHLRRSRLI